MGKRVLTCYDTGCLLDQLSFAQEMRESQLYVGVYTAPLCSHFLAQTVRLCYTSSCWEERKRCWEQRRSTQGDPNAEKTPSHARLVPRVLPL
jgi:hypothetical protein